MERVPVWVIAPDATFRDLLCDLLEQSGFEILTSTSAAGVCKDLVSGTAGLVVADASDLFTQAAYSSQIKEYCYLSANVPVLLLSNDPETVTVTREALGQCELLIEPVKDIEQIVDMLQRLAPKLSPSPPAIGSAF
jgi:DNA-binding NtrC family response regulator